MKFEIDTNKILLNGFTLAVNAVVATQKAVNAGSKWIAEKTEPSIGVSAATYMAARHPELLKPIAKATLPSDSIVLPSDKINVTEEEVK